MIKLIVERALVVLKYFFCFLKIRVAEAETATFEVTERKTTTRVRESESKREFITFFSHSKPYMRIHLARLLSDKRKEMSFFLLTSSRMYKTESVRFIKNI